MYEFANTYSYSQPYIPRFEIRDRPIDRVDELYARAKQNEKFPVRWSYNLFGPHCAVRINISISVIAVEQARG